MLSALASFFTVLLVQPIYNLFVFFIGILPGGDVGLAIIALTVLMRVVLYPVFAASIRSQIGMQAIQAETDILTEKYKNDPQELARQRVSLFKKHKVNPFAAVGTAVIQLIVIICLYVALFREDTLPAIKTALLYPFVHAPAAVSTSLLGFVNLLTPHHIVLTLLVAATQFLAIRLTFKRTNVSLASATAERQAAMRMQQNMMTYFMPAMIGVFAYLFPAAVGLYFLTGNLLTMAQELLIRKHMAL